MSPPIQYKQEVQVGVLSTIIVSHCYIWQTDRIGYHLTNIKYVYISTHLIKWTMFHILKYDFSTHSYKSPVFSTYVILVSYSKLVFSNSAPFAHFLQIQNWSTIGWISDQTPGYVVGTKTVGGKKSLQYFGPWSWNEFQSDLKLASLIPLRSFKRITLDRSKNICTCYDV